jgi:DNA-binding FadR family transcriptional regulator
MARKQLTDLDGGLGSASLLLTRIRSGNAFEETVQRILQTLKLGLAQPGDRLPTERELAQMLEVSRDTVREATASLAEAGYLLIKRGRYGGTFVADRWPQEPAVSLKISPSEISNILIFREAVECGAAYSAANAELSQEVREGLWQAHLETSSAKAKDYRRLDSRLHLLIAEVTGSTKLVGEVAFARMKINELLDQIPLLPPNISHSNDQHEQIVTAILRGNGDEASRAMRIHLSGSEALLRGFLA